MSYDVTFRIGPQIPCPACGHSALKSGEELFSANHTSNTSRMWRMAGCDLIKFHGKRAHELTTCLRDAIQVIATNQEEYKLLEPENGWGTVLSTLKFLKSVCTACDMYPDAVLEIDN